MNPLWMLMSMNLWSGTSNGSTAYASGKNLGDGITNTAKGDWINGGVGILSGAFGLYMESMMYRSQANTWNMLANFKSNVFGC